MARCSCGQHTDVCARYGCHEFDGAPVVGADPEPRPAEPNEADLAALEVAARWLELDGRHGAAWACRDLVRSNPYRAALASPAQEDAKT